MDIDLELNPDFIAGKQKNIPSFQNVQSPVLERISQNPPPNLQGVPNY